MIRHCLRPTLALVSFLLLLGGCGKAPIEEAVGKNDRQAVTEAIKAGADVNARTSSGDLTNAPSSRCRSWSPTLRPTA